MNFHGINSCAIQTRNSLEHAMAVLLISLDLGPIRIELAKRPPFDVA